MIAMALAEGFLSGVCSGAILVWFYNRFLASRRESYAKKAMSLATIPLATLAGALHAVAVLADFPHSSIPALAGLAIVVLKARTVIRQRKLRRGVVRQHLEVGTHGINWRRYHPVVRAGLGLLAPINRVDRLELVEVEARIPGLHPDMDGYRILHLTDFHVHPTLRKQWFGAVIDRSLDLGPDAVLVGGDYVSRRWHGRNAEAALAGLAHLDVPVLAIRGNHDFWTGPRFFARMLRNWGAELMVNDLVLLTRGEGALWVAGIEAPYIPMTHRAVGELRGRMESERPDAPRLGLVHTPEAFSLAAELGCAFAIAGHTHGGQIRLPFFGTTIAGCAEPAEFVWGMGHVGGMTTCVSNGIGAFFPLRVMCPPQVVVVTLRAG